MTLSPFCLVEGNIPIDMGHCDTTTTNKTNSVLKFTPRLQSNCSLPFNAATLILNELMPSVRRPNRADPASNWILLLWIALAKIEPLRKSKSHKWLARYCF